jgi:hypothetical protein
MWTSATYLIGVLSGIAATVIILGLNKLIDDIRGGIKGLSETLQAVSSNQHSFHGALKSTQEHLSHRLNTIEKLVTPVVETPAAPEPSDKLDNRSV